MQDCKFFFCPSGNTSKQQLTLDVSVHAPLYDISLEVRSHSADEENKHLSDMRPVEKLLSVLHARFVVWLAHRRARCRLEDGRAWPTKRH
jgi:hypothetical protein